MEEAYQMSVEALGLSLTDRINKLEPHPSPSSFAEIRLDSPDSHLVIIQFDLDAY